jgi:flavin reductase (DIM6/NTAB) family NADH-FMN oxidoreductase RutF
MSNNGFKVIQPEDIAENTFKLIGEDWMLVTAGTLEKYNTMTASWGGLGVLWNKNVCFCFIRPSRYTYEFMEESETFTLSFFEEEYREALKICGSKSGREINKAQVTGLTPFEELPGMVSFNEAKLIIECKKIFFLDVIPENFLTPEIQKNYSDGDYHRMYIGEISRCLINK